MPIISIIIPVYKTEKYLNRCIDSILNQTFINFELILVDDGSPDDSGRICDDYARKDCRIRVIHQANQGASAARNRGIAEATGTYLMFCDSDDVVSPQWIERLIACMNDNDTLPMGTYCSDIGELGKEKPLTVKAFEKVSNTEYYLYNQAGIAGYLCNALYIRDIVVKENITLREQAKYGDYNEDLIFALQYAPHVSKIVYTGYSDYLYDVHGDSMSRSFDNYYQKYAEKYELWKDFLNKFSDNEEQNYKVDLAGRMLFHFLKSLQLEIDKTNFSNIIKRYRSFKHVLISKPLQECIAVGDTSMENQKVIRLIKRKRTMTVFAIYMFIKFKKGFIS